MMNAIQNMSSSFAVVRKMLLRSLRNSERALSISLRSEFCARSIAINSRVLFELEQEICL